MKYNYAVSFNIFLNFVIGCRTCFASHFNKSKQEYTFWDYFAGSWQKNYGMRIDHFLISNNLLDNAKSININTKPRSKTKPSDHTPIELEIN